MLVCPWQNRIARNIVEKVARIEVVPTPSDISGISDIDADVLIIEGSHAEAEMCLASLRGVPTVIVLDNSWDFGVMRKWSALGAHFVMDLTEDSQLLARTLQHLAESRNEHLADNRNRIENLLHALP